MLVLKRQVEWISRNVRRGNSQAQLPHHPKVVVEDAFDLGVRCSSINVLPHSLDQILESVPWSIIARPWEAVVGIGVTLENIGVIQSYAAYVEVRRPDVPRFVRR